MNEHTRRAARGLTVCALASSLVTAGFVGLGEASAAAGPAASSAGWQVTPLPPPSANLVGVGGTGRANETWATGFSISDGANGLAPIALRWNGTAWTQTPVPVQTDPAAQDTQTRLNSNPAELSRTNVWVVGDTAEIVSGQFVDRALIEHWNGTAWQQTPGTVLPDNSGLYSLDAVSPNNIWAGGVINGAPGLAHWDGRAWAPVVPDALNGLNPISWVSGISSSGPDDVWAVGPIGLSIHYDGHSWQKVPLPDLNGDEAWLQNVGTDRRFGTWAVGYRVGPDHVRRPLALHWCDGAWRVVATPDSSFTQFMGVAFTDSGPEAFGYIDGPTTAAAYGVRLPTGPSEHASVIAMPSQSSGINASVAQADGRSVWVVGTGALLTPSTVAPFAARSIGDPAGH